MNTFKFGELVEWATPGMTVEQCKEKSSLNRYLHRGRITKVIAAGELYTNDSYSARTRSHESYEVTEVGRKKKYWPLVNTLRKVNA